VIRLAGGQVNELVEPAQNVFGVTAATVGLHYLLASTASRAQTVRHPAKTVQRSNCKTSIKVQSEAFPGDQSLGQRNSPSGKARDQSSTCSEGAGFSTSTIPLLTGYFNLRS
jgi:hypothetical protein